MIVYYQNKKTLGRIYINMGLESITELSLHSSGTVIIVSQSEGPIFSTVTGQVFLE